jgi:hypothetical protein
MVVEAELKQTEIKAVHAPLQQMSGLSTAVQRPPATVEWIARLVIVLVACGMAWHTWGHWGDFQIDNGRELYIPAAILKGKLLFRDLWYMYGPLAPYLKALLFRVFGVHLTVLYTFGLVLTVGTAILTFEVGRIFRLGPLTSAVPALFFLVEAFYPFIRNFIFPYSYAASLGAFLGLACLYFVLRHLNDRHTSHLALAAILCGLAVLTKQEFGFACVVLLFYEIAASFFIQRSISQLFRNAAICLAGLVPALAVYGWFVWKLSARVLFIENWVSTPGTFFMRTFSKITMGDQGFRFVPSEMLQSAIYVVAAIALWVLLTTTSVRVIQKFRLSSTESVVLTTVASLAPLCIAALTFAQMFPFGESGDPSWKGLMLGPLVQAAFPKGIFLLVMVFTVWALWKLQKTSRTTLDAQDAGLGIYAALIGLRQMMELRPSLFRCSVFFNVPAFLIFIILLNRIIRRACRSLDERRIDLVSGSVMTTEIVLLFVLFFPKPWMLPSRLTTDFGSFYTRSDVATLFPEMISFMKSHTRNGKDILVLPEPASLYVFAGMDAPSHWSTLVPGTLGPDQEQQFIHEAAASQVRYVLIANRSFNEYGVRGFINDGYSHTIYAWIMANFEKVGQFGPIPGADYPPYTVWVFEKKQSLADEGENAVYRDVANANKPVVPDANLAHH